MSTTFGIINRELEQDEHGNIVGDEEPTAVAIRTKGGACWIYPFESIAFAFRDDVRVYPLDNTAQGIYTIGDIRKKIEEQPDL